ncbi:unnamed protein product [Agarophyton chilense]|eukprot:gb/GEZJ01008151.1/.p1 GENE.gb/GEZJ01008151.1/~~gb/GEZJ01008151.1/.p1  ORF type:complete len:267 (-),score=22.32 gb/GEZJ01008151.1/:297-1097(-)
MMLCKFAALGVALFATFAPVIAHNRVPHWSIAPYQTRYDRFTAAALPIYSYKEGCVSYPAVAPNGDYSKGLKPTGSPGGNCRDSNHRQVYTRARFFTTAERAGEFHGLHYAVMYAMFFPKDQGDRQAPLSLIEGHRYDWEEVVVFIDTSGKAVKAATSAHAGYMAVNRDHKYEHFWDGNHVKVKYGTMPSRFRDSFERFFTEPFKNNAFYPTTEFHSRRPKEACWSYMTPEMRESITNVDWGSASPKIVDSRFKNKVTDAWRAPLI